MLKKITFYGLYNAELIQFLTQYLGIIDTVSDQPPALAEAVRTLRGIRVALDSLHKSDPSSLITAELTALDEDRDDLYTGLLGHCRNLAYHSDPAVVEAGRVLMHVLHLYGDAAAFTRQPYGAESTDIDSVLTDLGRPDAAAALALSGANLWSVPLKAANDRFKERFLARNDEKAARELAYTMKTKRQDAAAAYDVVVRKINAFAETGDAAAWQPLIDRLNTLSGEYRQLLAARRGRATARAESAPATT